MNYNKYRNINCIIKEKEGESQRERLAKMTDQDLAKFKIEGLSTLHEIRDALRLSCEFMEFGNNHIIIIHFLFYTFLMFEWYR